MFRCAVSHSVKQHVSHCTPHVTLLICIYILYINVYLYRVYANVSTHVRMHISYNLHLASCTPCTFIFVCPVLTQDLLASEQKVSAEPDVKVLQVLCMPLCAERDVVVCSFQPFSAVFCSLFSKHLMVFYDFDIFGGFGALLVPFSPCQVTPEDEFLFLGCDGIFELNSNQAGNALGLK